MVPKMLCLLLMWPMPLLGQEGAEEQRLDRADFVDGLKKRGLTSLLSLYVQEHPPKSQEARLMTERELLLARNRDPDASPEERQQALTDANQRLETLLEIRPNDPKRLEWLLELARSRVFSEAEPLTFPLLFYGSASVEREARIIELMDSADRTIMELLTSLKEEFARIDRLPQRELDRLDQGGYLAKLEGLEPQARFAEWWATYYRAIARRGGSAEEKRKAARQIIDEMAAPEQSWVQTAPKPLQTQLSLLNGMCLRAAGDPGKAATALDGARALAEGLLTGAQREENLEWAWWLAALESARALADQGAYEAAVERLDSAERAGLIGDRFVYRLAAALERFRIYQSRARHELDAQAADRWRELSLRSLLELGGESEENRRRLGEALYAHMDFQMGDGRKEPLGRWAWIVGRCSELERQRKTVGTASSAMSYEEVAREGDAWLAGSPGLPGVYAADVLYHVGVARFRLQQQGLAVERWLELAQKYPTHAMAGQVATQAVQLAYSLTQAKDVADPELARQLYLKSLEGLLQGFGQTDEGRYWRFFYANALEEAGRRREAADQYLLVDSNHPHALEARLFRARALIEDLQSDEASGLDAVAARRRVDEAADLIHDFSKTVRERLSTEESNPSSSQALLSSLLVEADLVLAEMQLLPAVNRPQSCLEMLDGLPSAEMLPENQASKAMLLRLRALVMLQRYEDARPVLGPFLAGGPKSATRELQGCYEQIVKNLPPLGIETSDNIIRGAVELAQEIAAGVSAEARAEKESAAVMERLEAQWGEALARTGRWPEARELFMRLGGNEPIGRNPATARRAQIRFGLGLCRMAVGEVREALDVFNDLTVNLPVEEELRWRALLKELECREALGVAPADILKILANQEAVHAAMFARHAALFTALRKRCEEKAAGSAAPPAKAGSAGG